MKQLKLLLLIACTLAAWQIKGQNPPPSSFITIPIGNQSLTNQSSSGSETWYKWINDSTSAHVQLKLVTNGTNFVLANVELYALNTGSLELMNRDTIRPDSTLNLWTRNLISGNNLYLRIVTLNTGCSTCGTPLNPLFNLQITNITTSCGVYVPSSCDLIIDGGMDNYWTSCNIGNVTSAASYPGCYWAVPTWPSFTAGSTPDLYLSCAPTTPLNHAVNTNSNFSSNGLCTIGTNTVGAYAGANLFEGPGVLAAEYLYNHLAQPMQVGKPYHVSISVRLSCFSKYAISNLAIYFTTTTPSQPAPGAIPGIINPTAGQLVTFTTSPVSDKSNWITLTACFTPTIAYNYATFGCFTGTPNYVDLDPSNLWSYSPGGYTANTHSTWAYYYFDNVSIKPLNVNATGGTTFCIGNSTQLNANLQCSLSNSYTPTYSWTPSTGLSATNISNPIASPTTTTIYTVTAAIPNANGVSCGITQTVAVIVSNIPALTFSTNTPSICLGNTSTVTVAGALTYTWSNGATTSSVAVSPSVTTTYTVSGTNSCGYTNSATVNVVVVNPLTSITAAALTNSLCPGGVATLQAFGAASYTWFPTPSAASGSTATVHPNVTTTYTVTGSNNVCANTQSTTVTLVVMSPSVTIVLGNPCSLVQTFTANLNCNPSPQIYNFTWTLYNGTGGGPAIYSTQVLYSNVFTYTFTSTGVYTIGSGFYASTTGGSYGSSQTFTIVAPSTPTITTTASPSTICLGNSSTLTASGASTYTWSTGATTPTIVMSPTVTTTYTVTGTNSCGSTDTKTLTINVTPTQGSITASANPNPICVGASATLQATGAPNYTWTPSGANTASIVVTPSVTTTYTVVGSNGCGTVSTVVTITVSNGVVPSYSIVTPSLAVCANGTGTNTVLFSTTLTNTTGLVFTWNPSGIHTPTANISISQSTIVSLVVANNCGIVQTQSVCVNYVTTGCCTYTNAIGNTTVTTGTYNNQIIRVASNATITITGVADYTNSKLLMGTNSAIIVLPTALLKLENCKLFSCEGMWYGIKTLYDAVNTASVEVRNSTIEDAYKAIDADNALNSLMPAIKVYIGSVFNKNYTDVSIVNTVLHNGNNPLFFESSKMISQSSNTSPGTNLKCSGYYAPTIRDHSYVGLYAENAGVITFTYNQGGAGPNNLVKNKDYGLVFIKTSADVWNTDFKDMIGVPLTFPNVYPLGVAVVSQNAPKYLNVKPIGTSTLTGVTFSNIGYGIIANKTPTVDVQRCSFNNPLQGTNNYGTYGIYTIDANSLLRMNYNTINKTYYGCSANFSVIPTPATYSMSISNNTITAGTGSNFQSITVAATTTYPMMLGAMVVAANQITKAKTGIFTTNVHNGLRISGNTITLITTSPRAVIGIFLAGNNNGLMVDNNNINGNQTGIVGNYNLNCYGIRSDLSPNCFVQCNTITKVGNGITYNGNNAGSGSNANFFKNTLTYPIRRGLVLMNGGVIGQQGSASGASANVWSGFANPTGVDQTMVGVSGVLSSALNSKLYVRNILNVERPTDNNFSGTSGPIDIYTSPSSLISLSTAAPDVVSTGCPTQLTAGFRVALTTNNNVAQRNIDYTNYITTVVTPTATSTIPQAKWLLKQHMHKTIRQTAIGADTTVASFYAVEQVNNVATYFAVDSLLSEGNMSLANAVNSGAGVSNNLEQNHKDYNTVYLNGAVSASDYATLQTLANLCAYENGNAVYQARALLNMLSYTTIDYNDSCGSEKVSARLANTSETKGVSIETITAKLYPNPNNGEFTLAYDLKQTPEATINISDVTGNIVYTAQITNETNLININTNDLRSGMYFIQLNSKDSLLWTNKIMISK